LIAIGIVFSLESVCLQHEQADIVEELKERRAIGAEPVIMNLS